MGRWPRSWSSSALLGCLYDITSESRLAAAAQPGLSVVVGHDLDETSPDHSILSKARRRHGLEAYRQFSSEIVTQGIDQGLADGDRL